MIKEITRKLAAERWPVRAAHAHKGSFGRVLVVAGSRTMCGAGFLCAKSALLAGAGLVFWALPKSMQPAFAAALPEVITLPLPETDDGLVSAAALETLEEFCSERKPSLTVVGPGMGPSPLLPRLLPAWKGPLLADADALNAWAAHPEMIVPADRPLICTPHPGEMARLLKTQTAPDETLREEQAAAWAKQSGGVCVLKGRGTLVCASRADGAVEMWRNPTGGPALAKAGSGDVLSGVIAGLWAQLGSSSGFHAGSALDAALCGVYAHGLAGDLAARARTDWGVLAGDTAQNIPAAVKEILK